MDLLTRNDLEQLASRERDGEHVSLYIPTHRVGAGVQGDRIRWKNTVTGAASVLAERGMRQADIDDLLAPARALEGDNLAWQYMSDGLAMFLSPGFEQTYRVPIDVPAVATVGDRFVVGPLMPILSGDEHFLLLALSQRRMRLLEGTRDRVDEVELGDIPTSLREVVAPAEPRSDAMARPLGGRGGPAVFYGHGASDDQFKTDEVERYLRQFAEGLEDYLTDHDLPMVLVGLDLLVATYREVSDYPSILEPSVVQNPDELTSEQLHAAAWPVVAERVRGSRQQVIDRFHELHGTGRATTDPAKIVDAAVDGRIDTLFLPDGPSCWASAESGSSIAFGLGSDDSRADCELLDRAAVETLMNSGRVLTVPLSEMPGGGAAAAVFRY